MCHAATYVLQDNACDVLILACVRTTRLNLMHCATIASDMDILMRCLSHCYACYALIVVIVAALCLWPQAALECVKERFQQLTAPEHKMEIDCGDNDPASTLQIQLSLLKSVTAKRRATAREVIVRLAGTKRSYHAQAYALTQAAMEALRDGLPHFSQPSTLHLDDCSFTLRPHEYHQLAQCVPLCYREWYLHFVDPRQPVSYDVCCKKEDVLRMICNGIAARREGLKKGPLQLFVRNVTINRLGAHPQHVCVQYARCY